MNRGSASCVAGFESCYPLQEVVIVRIIVDSLLTNTEPVMKRTPDASVDAIPGV